MIRALSRVGPAVVVACSLALAANHVGTATATDRAMKRTATSACLPNPCLSIVATCPCSGELQQPGEVAAPYLLPLRLREVPQVGIDDLRRAIAPDQPIG